MPIKKEVFKSKQFGIFDDQPLSSGSQNPAKSKVSFRKEPDLLGSLKILLLDSLISERYIKMYHHNFINICQEIIILARTFYNVFLRWMLVDKHICQTEDIL